MGEKEFDPWSCSEDSSFLHHHDPLHREKDIHEQGWEKRHMALQGEAGRRQGSSTHLFVLGSWWEAGGGMSEVLQCPLQG